MKNMKCFLILVLLLAFPAVIYSAVFTETFSNLDYIDPSGTSLTTMVDTTNKWVSLPLVSAFTDMSSDITSLLIGRNVFNVAYANSDWIISGGGGSNEGPGMILKYDGTTFADITDPLLDKGIRATTWGGAFWLFGGGGTYGGLNFFRFIKYAPDDYMNWLGSLNGWSGGWGSEDKIYTIAKNDSYWLVGGGNQSYTTGRKGILNRWDGAYDISGVLPTTFINLSTDADFQTTGATITNACINTLCWNGSYWLIGGGIGNTITKLKKYDGSTFVDLTAAADFTLGSATITICAITKIAWNGSYWLIGGTNGKLKKYDGTTFTDLTNPLLDPAGGNFKYNGYTSGINTLCWTGYEWLIGGRDYGYATGLLVKWDGKGDANSNFVNMSSVLAGNLKSSGISSIAFNGNIAMAGGGVGLNRVDAIYNGANYKYVASKKINYITTDRTYKAKLTPTEELNGQYVKYMISADGGVNWQDVDRGVDARLVYTGTDLRWRAEMGGRWISPKLLNPLTIEYSTCDQSILPSGAGGEIFSLTDSLTKIVLEPNNTVVDTQFSLTKDTNPPVSAVNPTTGIVVYDITAKDFYTGTTIESFLNTITITIHCKSPDGTYVDSGKTVLLSKATTELALAFWNGVHWIPLSSTVTVNGSDIYVSAKTFHLSKYAIVKYSPTDIPTTVEPNPFTPTSTNSTFNKITISFSNNNSDIVVLKIWDRNAALVKELTINGVSSIGWDGRNRNGEIVGSGVYIYEVRVGSDSKGRGTIVVAR